MLPLRPLGGGCSQVKRIAVELTALPVVFSGDKVGAVCNVIKTEKTIRKLYMATIIQVQHAKIAENINFLLLCVNSLTQYNKLS